MRWSWSELLIVLSVMLIAIMITWSVVYVFAPSAPMVRIYETDGPEMRRATKAIMEQVERERK